MMRRPRPYGSRTPAGIAARRLAPSGSRVVLACGGECRERPPARRPPVRWGRIAAAVAAAVGADPAAVGRALASARRDERERRARADGPAPMARAG